MYKKRFHPSNGSEIRWVGFARWVRSASKPNEIYNPHQRNFKLIDDSVSLFEQITLITLICTENY